MSHKVSYDGYVLKTGFNCMSTITGMADHPWPVHAPSLPPKHPRSISAHLRWHQHPLPSPSPCAYTAPVSLPVASRNPTHVRSGEIHADTAGSGSQTVQQKYTVVIPDGLYDAPGLQRAINIRGEQDQRAPSHAAGQAARSGHAIPSRPEWRPPHRRPMVMMLAL